MLLRNALFTARSAQAASSVDFALSVSEPRVDKLGTWLTSPEGEAFRMAARAAGYRSCSDCLRDLVLMSTSVGGFLDLRQKQLAKPDQSRAVAVQQQ